MNAGVVGWMSCISRFAVFLAVGAPGCWDIVSVPVPAVCADGRGCRFGAVCGGFASFCGFLASVSCVRACAGPSFVAASVSFRLFVLMRGLASFWECAFLRYWRVPLFGAGLCSFAQPGGVWVVCLVVLLLSRFCWCACGPAGCGVGGLACSLVCFVVGVFAFLVGWWGVVAGFLCVDGVFFALLFCGAGLFLSLLGVVVLLVWWGSRCVGLTCGGGGG